MENKVFTLSEVTIWDPNKYRIQVQTDIQAQFRRKPCYRKAFQRNVVSIRFTFGEVLNKKAYQSLKAQ